MKSKHEQLANRGYLTDGADSKYLNLTFIGKIKLLQSKIPTERTLGAKLLADSKDNKAAEYLVNALTVEKKLYCKIEICNSLVSCGQLSIKHLIEILGTVGTNQHKKVPQKKFKKDSYPLPRDIAARTLVRFGKDALSELMEILENGDEKQLSEAIDTIGFICFYEYKPEIYIKLKDCYLKNSKNKLIKWKIIRAMSSFPKSKTFLQEQKQRLQNKRLLQEIERSLLLIKMRK